MISYKPSKKILENYANILVNFALGSGKGIKKGEVVRISADEAAKPLFLELRKAVWKAGGHVISHYLPSNDAEYNVERDFYEYAEEHHLNFFPEKYLRGIVDQIDHSIFVISETDKQALNGIDPKKIMTHGKTFKPFMDWRNDKENKGRFTWTLGLYGTEAMAKEVGLSLKQYWLQIIKACFLDEKNPIVKWKQVTKSLKYYEERLNSLNADRFYIEGPDADLWIKQGEKRTWVGGSGRNIPSFELFTSPDWRGTNGWIKFNQPLYRYGNVIEGVELTFKKGIVVDSKATKNEKVLKEMIATEGADKIGEFSLTDRRFSRITHFMAETLFDENIGGPNGNTHIALGNAYNDCYKGDPSKVSKVKWKRLGYNTSSVHTDIVSTSPRKVTAFMKNGTKKVIYKNGQFVL
ncbi:MAG: aminopeptidase [Candidatus Paceibacterota bacterium]